MYNKQHLLGEVVTEPRTKSFPDGKSVTDFEMITWDEWLKDGKSLRKTERHKVTCRGKLSDIAYDLLEGDRLYVTGTTRHRGGEVSVLADELRIV